MHTHHTRQGVAFGIAAYTLWGLLPLYWKALKSVPAFEILCHRTVWSFLFLIIILLIRKNWQWLKTIKDHPNTKWTFLTTSLLLGCNWLTYIWAVNNGYIVESSLGYFINPIVNILLGVIILKEKLRLWQWIAAGLATAGVIYLTVVYGQLPWIALVLAFSFGFYGLLRKTAHLGSLEGLSLETLVMFVPGIIYILFVEIQGNGQFIHSNITTILLLTGTGIATATPLLFFASAARRIQYSTVGLLQYIAPTLQFSIGVLIYHEAFNRSRLIGFSEIWLALIIYTVDSLMNSKKG